MKALFYALLRIADLPAAKATGIAIN